MTFAAPLVPVDGNTATCTSVLRDCSSGTNNTLVPVVGILLYRDTCSQDSPSRAPNLVWLLRRWDNSIGCQPSLLGPGTYPHTPADALCPACFWDKPCL